MITTQSELRKEFWKSHPHLTRHAGWKQNDYGTITRVSWCDFIELMARERQISEALASRATL